MQSNRLSKCPPLAQGLPCARAESHPCPGWPRQGGRDMTLLRSWSPNGNVHDEMQRLLHDLVLTGEPGQSAWLPPVDVHESDTSYTLQFDLPGVDAKEVRIEMNDGQLTIKGERKS